MLRQGIEAIEERVSAVIDADRADSRCIRVVGGYDTQFGVLMRGMLSYRFEGKEAEFDDPMVALCFDFLKPQLQRYDEICEINRLNRNKRKTEVQEDASVCDEVPRKTTESSKSKRKATQNQTQIQTQVQTQTQVQSQNQKKKESKKRCLIS